VIFLQLVAGARLLLFVTRTERWFFMPPFPAAPLVVLSGIRLATERALDHCTATRLRSAEIVTQSLRPHVPAGPAPARSA
jgi:hypothetical protein